MIENEDAALKLLPGSVYPDPSLFACLMHEKGILKGRSPLSGGWGEAPLSIHRRYIFFKLKCSREKLLHFL